MNIDWSKAPAWAVGHALHAFGGEIREVWVGEHQYQRLDQPKPFPYGGGNSDHRHNPRRSEFHFEQLRPAPWTGKGLPPVGTVCESVCGGIVRKVEVLAVGKKNVFLIEGGEEKMFSIEGTRTFRPIRTPEQIEAEEREQDAQSLFELINPEGKWHKFAEEGKARFRAAVAAGYRKQVSE